MYAEFYKMRLPAFQLSPDARFFFESAVHSRAYAYLQYGLSQNDGFIVVTGEVGAGKTTLVQRLLSTLDPDRYLTANIVSTQLKNDDLLRMVASGLHIAHGGLDKVSVLQEIESILVARCRVGQRCLLMVDEAQNLGFEALEELRMLSNLQFGSSPLVQSFILGQPQLRSVLGREELSQLRDRVIASYHLGPMTETETAEYVMHRLRLADWKSDPEFDASALSEIHQYSEGIPRRINNLCTRLLIYGFLEKMHTIGATAVKSVIKELEAEKKVYEPTRQSLSPLAMPPLLPSVDNAQPPNGTHGVPNGKPVKPETDSEALNKAIGVYQSRVQQDDPVVRQLRSLSDQLKSTEAD